MAHSDNVNCLSLGKTSGGVLATGGDDKKVNIWTLSKLPNVVMVCSIDFSFAVSPQGQRAVSSHHHHHHACSLINLTLTNPIFPSKTVSDGS